MDHFSNLISVSNLQEDKEEEAFDSLVNKYRKRLAVVADTEKTVKWYQ